MLALLDINLRISVGRADGSVFADLIAVHVTAVVVIAVVVDAVGAIAVVVADVDVTAMNHRE